MITVIIGIAVALGDTCTHNNQLDEYGSTTITYTIENHNIDASPLVCNIYQFTNRYTRINKEYFRYIADYHTVLSTYAGYRKCIFWKRIRSRTWIKSHINTSLLEVVIAIVVVFIIL